MLPVVSMLLIALAVSLDGFGVGVTYGLRKIRIPVLSTFVIALCSGIVIFASMQAGVWLSQYVDPYWAKVLGSIILIAIGSWAVWQFVWQQRNDAKQPPAQQNDSDLFRVAPNKQRRPREVLYIEIKRLGLVIQILRSPSIADIDRSGNISVYEAVLLGTALSLDALGAGLGAALLGLTPWVMAVVIVLASGIFLNAGMLAGLRFSGGKRMKSISLLPGIVLIIMGILKLL